LLLRRRRPTPTWTPIPPARYLFGRPPQWMAAVPPVQLYGYGMTTIAAWRSESPRDGRLIVVDDWPPPDAALVEIELHDDPRQLFASDRDLAAWFTSSAMLTTIASRRGFRLDYEGGICHLHAGYDDDDHAHLRDTALQLEAALHVRALARGSSPELPLPSADAGDVHPGVAASSRTRASSV
jgi:hypothetical protein